ncbi:MAG: hypothetical protein NXH85_13720 [Pseudomonadaceae bacterium]|nr:hypothetical protein [Pseudomonadaceae bacterium]
MNARRILLAITACGTLLVAGCSSELAEMDDADLADRMHECRTVVDQSPGMAITCDNYQRECNARRKAGKFVC